MTTLATYEIQVQDLLHDLTAVIWTTTQLDRYINEARRQLVMDTGCQRSLQTCYLTAGSEAYVFGQITGATITAAGTGYVTPTVSFSGGGGSGVAATLGVTNGAVTSITFTSLGSGYSSAPTATINPVGGGSGAAITVGVINVNTYDVLDVYVIFGASRYRLGWRPFSTLSTLMRPYTTLQQMPKLWAFYGSQGIYIAPQPDQSYQAEVDTVILPTDLVNGTDVDPLPSGLLDAVKFYAAYVAKFNLQQFGEAETFRKEYGRLLMERSAAYIRRITNPYAIGTQQ